jgi:sugar O-acyltransferase (sialic acid O-acetyltransferase NeuD family)
MNVKPIVLIGGGGHCKSCIEVIDSTAAYSIVGILDKAEKVGQLVIGYEINGTEADIPKLVARGYSFCITFGQLKSSEVRATLYRYLIACGADVPTIISPKAYVSTHARIGNGTVIFHSAIVNAGAGIGDNCIINTGALIEHDVTVQDYVHVATHAVVNGEANIGSGALIGSGAVVLQQITIGPNVVVGAGSIVIHPLEEGIFGGNPARRIG